MRCLHVVLTIGLTLSSACTLAAKPPVERPTDEGIQVTDSNLFALDLYGRISKAGGNVFFSPYSISSALAMTLAGAEGATAEQMCQVLHLELAGDRLHSAFGNLTKSLNQAGGKESFQLTIANALWGQEGYDFLDSFLSLVKGHYEAGLNHVNFQQDAEAARATINEWVAQKTGGRIKDLIKPGVLNSMTRLVLTNAIYFKGQWAHAFDPKNTTDEPFTMADGKKVDVRMMHVSGQFRYGAFDHLKVLEVPYRSDRLSMVIVLPESHDGLPRVERQLGIKSLELWLGKSAAREVDVALPRFTLRDELDLSRTLKSMGMEDAFDPGKADFSGMDGTRKLHISNVIHEAFVDVNEEGTEAATATGVVMRATSIGPAKPSFRADHPFLFLIRDTRTGAILFMGRLTQPSAFAEPTESGGPAK